MRLTIDTGKCSGHARCWEAAPDTFDIDDNGYALPLDLEVSDPPAESILAGIAACPERAISLH